MDAAGTSGRDGEDLGGYLVILDIGFDWGNVAKGAAADAAAPLDYVDISFRYNRIYCRPLSGTIPKGRHLFSGWRAHDVRPLRGQLHTISPICRERS